MHKDNKLIFCDRCNVKIDDRLLDANGTNQDDIYCDNCLDELYG